ncbi:MAG TPA: LytR C-terminal domain-containing protein [Thermoleophilia bacterium]|nr:LytR C-terminal domain-containing protein [Thermoleophilia bacterium]
MPERKGYRSDRLRRRRRRRVERRQAWILYVMAALVAFVAVLGAWYLAGRVANKDQPAKKSGYLAAIQLTVPGKDAPVAALLAVQDPEGGDPGVYLVPPDLLLEGPDGEYVFAADAMQQGVLAKDLGRVVNVPVDAVYTVPVSKLGDWAGTGEIEVQLDKPVAVEIGGESRMIKDGDLVPVADLPAIFSDEGDGRRELTTLQTALVKAVLDAAALRPAADRSHLAGPSPSPSAWPGLSAVLARITSGDAQVQRFPAGTRVAEGQFAFVPDAEEIMAGITRRSPAYHAAVTVEVRNGSGKIGVARAVVERLASLDVNLPAPLNADSFDYQQTQILAGPDTLPVARDIRAILGRGVVLDGSGLPKHTIRVIVGDDFQPPQPSPKDQQ